MTRTSYKKYGFVSIPLVLALSVLILSVGLLAITSAFNNINSSGKFSDAAMAFSYAETAVKDVLTRISVNPNYASSGVTYTIDFGNPSSTTCISTSNGCAIVRVEGDTIPSPRVITVIGKYKDVVRKIQFIARVNDVGGLFGADQVEIKNLPIVATGAPTNLSGTPSSSAVLNGWVNPNTSATSPNTPIYAWFRYSTTDPVTCNDSFGNLVNVSGAGNSSGITGLDTLSFSTSATNFSARTTYYYCAIIGDNLPNANPTFKVYGGVSIFQSR